MADKVWFFTAAVFVLGGFIYDSTNINDVVAGQMVTIGALAAVCGYLHLIWRAVR